MELLKQLAFNGFSMLLALLVAFFLLYLFGLAKKKKGGCGCGCGGSCGGAAQAAGTDYQTFLDAQ